MGYGILSNSIFGLFEEILITDVWWMVEIQIALVIQKEKKIFKRMWLKRPYMFLEIIINSSLMCFELLSRVFQNIDRQ